MAPFMRLMRWPTQQVNKRLRPTFVAIRYCQLRLRVECLEDRSTPAVTALTDPGALTPPDFLSVLNFSLPAPFNPEQGITLSEQELAAVLRDARGLGFSAVIPFGSTGLENLPRLAREQGFQFVVGAVYWYDVATLDHEIQAVVRMKDFVDLVVVGSEGLREGRYTIGELERVMDRVGRLTGKPVVTAESIDQFIAHPELARLGAATYVNIHPWFAGIRDPIAGAEYVADQVSRLRESVGPDRLVVVREAWWPTGGGDPAATEANQVAFFAALRARGVAVMAPEFHDQFWKLIEGPQGQYWGVRDSKGNPKPIEQWLREQLAARPEVAAPLPSITRPPEHATPASGPAGESLSVDEGARVASPNSDLSAQELPTAPPANFRGTLGPTVFLAPSPWGATLSAQPNWSGGVPAITTIPLEPPATNPQSSFPIPAPAPRNPVQFGDEPFEGVRWGGGLSRSLGADSGSHRFAEGIPDVVSGESSAAVEEAANGETLSHFGAAPPITETPEVRAVSNAPAGVRLEPVVGNDHAVSGRPVWGGKRTRTRTKWSVWGPVHRQRDPLLVNRERREGGIFRIVSGENESTILRFPSRLDPAAIAAVA